MNEEKIISCESDKNADWLKRAQQAMPSEDDLINISELFKVYGDSTRVHILSALKNQELCVCAIGEVLNMTKSAVSHQLRILRQAKLVKCRRSGKEMIYSLDDEHVEQIFSLALKHINE
jgi:ArsR family transcriptional regulator